MKTQNSTVFRWCWKTKIKFIKKYWGKWTVGTYVKAELPYWQCNRSTDTKRKKEREMNCYIVDIKKEGSNWEMKRDAWIKKMESQGWEWACHRTEHKTMNCSLTRELLVGHVRGAGGVSSELQAHRCSRFSRRSIDCQTAVTNFPSRDSTIVYTLNTKFHKWMMTMPL